ncbi:LysM peptidoglycan-binding domain-containing protein [Streptomyces sp. NPDC007851]|uniref:LysM peptidoglycan-binding domain-containing protein n=1 Tax=Streptomyces sp. NPDC007851 TaxID=3155008 RepID=UPI0034091C3E
MDKRRSRRPGSRRYRVRGLPGRPVWQLITGLMLLCCAAVLAVTALQPVTADATAAPSTTSAAAPAARPAPTAKPAPRPDAEDRPVRHRSAATAPRTTFVMLRAGDTLWALAHDHGTTVTVLQRLNGLGHSTLIYAGRTLRMPAAHAAARRHTRASAHVRFPVHPLASRRATAHDRPTATQIAAASLSRTRVNVPPGSPRQLAAQVFGSQYVCAAHIIARESGWSVAATNPSSGAYGLAQALPGSKMAGFGSDWRTNPATQLRWMRSYVHSRYGGACAAWAFWQTHRWY